MFYIILDTKEVVSQGELRRRNPETSFPAVWGQDVLDFLGVAVVFSAPHPVYDSISQMVVQGEPILTNKGHYEQTWNIINLEPAVVQQNQAAKLAQVKSSIINVVQTKLDDFAKTRNYDSILSATTYATSTNLVFKAEGQYCVEARDNTWTTLYTILMDVENGLRDIPTGYSDIESELPQLQWPS